MRINYKGSADLNKYELAVNNSRDGKTAVLHFTVGVDQEDAEKQFGERFKAFFSPMEENQEGVVWPIGKMKPNKKKFTCEKHAILINEHRIEVHPELTSVEPVEETPRVWANIKIPIDVKEQKFVKRLHENMEATADVEIFPLNEDLEETIDKQQNLRLAE